MCVSSGNRPLPEPGLPEAPLESGCGVMEGHPRASPPSIPVTLYYQSLHGLDCIVHGVTKRWMESNPGSSLQTEEEAGLP